MRENLGIIRRPVIETNPAEYKSSKSLIHDACSKAHKFKTQNAMNIDTKIQVFGIPNCQSVKKARDWLSSKGVDHEFHDFKKSGIDEKHLTSWITQVGLEVVLNKKGTTWRQLPKKEQDAMVDEQAAVQAMITHPSLIKRPVIDFGKGHVCIGVNPEAWSNVIGM